MHRSVMSHLCNARDHGRYQNSQKGYEVQNPHVLRPDLEMEDNEEILKLGIPMISTETNTLCEDPVPFRRTCLQDKETCFSCEVADGGFLVLIFLF